MPKDYAKKLAEMLMDHDEDAITVDVPNDGFNEAVAKELESLGHQVERHLNHQRLTIHRGPIAKPG